MRYLTVHLEVPGAKQDDYTRFPWSARSAGLIDTIEAPWRVSLSRTGSYSTIFFDIFNSKITAECLGVSW